MSAVWRGGWIARARIVSGLILFSYALMHFINIGLGLFSPGAMEWMQTARQGFTRSVVGTFLIYGALITHIALALSSVARRGTLRMSLREVVQWTLGLTIPFFLLTHIIFTRGAHEVFAVNDDYGYLIGLIWGSTSAWTQSALILMVWVHSSIGLHIWLRGERWWRNAQAWLIAGAVLVPGFALAGFVAEARRVSPLLADPETAPNLYAQYMWPEGIAFRQMIDWKDTSLAAFWVLVGASILIFALRWLIRRRSSVAITYVDGPRLNAPKGLTLLEMSQSGSVPHTALCGGKGRCTTCRVLIEEGGDSLPPPSAAEARSLKAVDAPPGTRLACQIRPETPLRVFRVFQADGKRRRAHASQGQERRLAILFLDMRGFTARTAGQLPYDVVFLLNRFFDAIVPAITEAGGTVDKYLGDGLLAVFETGEEAASARAALEAAAGIGERLEDFNKELARENAPEVRIGIGLHVGEIVLGEIGAGNAPRTIIGNAVNTASRLEAQTKELGVPLLVTRALLRSAAIDVAPDRFTALSLRGVNEPVAALPLQDLTAVRSLLSSTEAAPAE